MSRLSLALVRRAWERGSLVPRPFEARERGDSSCVEELLIYYWIPYGQVANLSIAQRIHPSTNLSGSSRGKREKERL